MIFKTGNEIIQTGNGIISPTSGPLIKKLLLQHLLHINQGLQNLFSKQEMELFLQLPGLGWKNSFYKDFPLYSKEIKIYLQTGNGIIQTGDGIISPSSCRL